MTNLLTRFRNHRLVFDDTEFFLQTNEEGKGNGWIFDALGIDSKELSIRVLGYSLGGFFPQCKNTEDLKKLTLEIENLIKEHEKKDLIKKNKTEIKKTYRIIFRTELKNTSERENAGVLLKIEINPTLRERLKELLADPESFELCYQKRRYLIKRAYAGFFNSYSRILFNKTLIDTGKTEIEISTVLEVEEMKKAIKTSLKDCERTKPETKIIDLGVIE